MIYRLLTTATGLEAFLSAINYALYILAYLETPSPSGSALLQQLFRLGSSRPKLPQDAPSGSSQTSTQPTAPLGTLASLISDTRITLRLTAILPLYTWLRELVADNRRQDQYLRTISYIQCMSYIIYQLTENVAFLTDRGIVSRRWLERTGGSAKWWLWSSRAWLIGVCCDFLRLCREALNERQRRLVARQARKENTEAETSKQQEIDRTWWTNMFIASCWLPLCLHYSLQNGLKGVNNGVIGLLGFMAAAQSFMAQWAKTEAT